MCCPNFSTFSLWHMSNRFKISLHKFVLTIHKVSRLQVAVFVAERCTPSKCRPCQWRTQGRRGEGLCRIIRIHYWDIVKRTLLISQFYCIQVSGTEFFTAVLETCDGGGGGVEEIIPIVRGGCLRNTRLPVL